MSARPKQPGQPPPRSNTPTQRGRPTADEDAKTSIYDSGKFPNKPAAEPFKAISMKTPGDNAIGADAYRAEPEVKKPKLRSISDVMPTQRPAQNLGYLAPPRDPAGVRARRVYDYVLWGSIAVIFASVVALVIWFAAR